MVQTVNVTLDDYSPAIEYSPAGAWIDGSTADPFWQSYTNNGTFTVTTALGASASLTFNGTAIWIYGAKRGNHGPYNVTLDGELLTGDGYFNGQIFQQVLFSAVGLNNSRTHTVSIINSPTDSARPYLDIDLIVYQMEVPDDDKEVKEQDTASNFQYSMSGWSTNPDHLESYDGGTGHSTALGDAYANYTFQGSHVELYGIVGPFNGLFTVQLDDGPQKILNASRSKFTPQLVLYQQSGLGPGNHTLRITNAPFTGQTLSIDYAIVGQSLSDTSTGNNSPSPSLTGGVIGGIVAGASGFLLVIMVLLFLWYRRRHKKPTILPRDVLQAEFTSNDGDADAADSSTRLRPYLDSTITRYHVSSLPASVSFPSSGDDHSPAPRDGPSFYRASHRTESLPSSSSKLFVHNAESRGSGSGANWSGTLPDAAEEKRRLAAAMRERDRRPAGSGALTKEFVQGAYGSGDDDGGRLPDYHQATRPSGSNVR